MYKIFNRFVYQSLGFGTIAKRLNDEGISSPSGKTWGNTTIKNILKTTEYRGYYTREAGEDEEAIVVQTPAIIDIITFDMAQELMKDNEEKGNRGGEKKYLLSGKIVDTETRRKFVGVTRTKGGFSYRRKGYFNNNGEQVANKEIPGKELDQFVWNRVEQFINNPVHFYEIYKKQTTESKQLDDLKRELTSLDSRIEEQRLIQFNIEKDYYAGKVSEEKKNYHIEEAEERITKHNFRKHYIEKEIQQILDIETAKYIIEDISNNFINKIVGMTEEQKRQLVNILVDEIQVRKMKDNYLEINVLFKFAHIESNDNKDMSEPSNSISKIKSAVDDTSLISNDGRFGVKVKLHHYMICLLEKEI